MKAKIIDLLKKKEGHPKVELLMSILGDALRGRLTPKLMKARQRRARRNRRTQIEI